MTRPFVPDLQEIRRVPAGTALRLEHHPKDRELLVLRGRAWITMTAPARQACGVAPQGDHFVAAGERLRLPAGFGLVVEAAGRRSEAVAFGWQPLVAPRLRSDIWAAQVALPWSDLCGAVRTVAGSSQRLLRGLATCALREDRPGSNGG